MHRPYYISLLILALLVAGLSAHSPTTGAEVLPISSAMNWVEGRGRALSPDLIGTESVRRMFCESAQT